MFFHNLKQIKVKIGRVKLKEQPVKLGDRGEKRWSGIEGKITKMGRVGRGRLDKYFGASKAVGGPTGIGE